MAELRNYFNAFIKEPEKTPEEPKVEEKTKGSILKRLKEKFSPKMSKKVCGVERVTFIQTKKALSEYFIHKTIGTHNLSRSNYA